MPQKTRPRAVLLIALIVCLAGTCPLTGCASVYARFYEPAPSTHTSPVSPEAGALYEYSRNPERDGQQLAREGYVLIGTSCFLGQADPGTPDRSYAGKQAMRQGMKVGAASDFSFNWGGTIRQRCS